MLLRPFELRFPAQEYISGASKIPTIIYYDAEGAVKAVGAEAVSESAIQSAEEEEWSKAEWFVALFAMSAIHR